MQYVKEEDVVIMKGKKTEKLPEIRVPSTMADDLMRLAALQDRKVSDYIRHVLARHLYGVVRSDNLDDEGQK